MPDIEDHPTDSKQFTIRSREQPAYTIDESSRRNRGPKVIARAQIVARRINRGKKHQYRSLDVFVAQSLTEALPIEACRSTVQDNDGWGCISRSRQGFPTGGGCRQLKSTPIKNVDQPPRNWFLALYKQDSVGV